MQMLFGSEEGRLPNYLIAALAVTNDGDILAAYDGDWPAPNSDLQRRIPDNGVTWEELTVLHAGQTSTPIEGFSDPS